MNELLHDLFAITLNVGLVNVNILIENENTAIWSLHFYLPYIQNCHSFTVLQLDSYSPQNYTHHLNTSFRNLFPPKMLKLANCPLYVATFPFPPFVIVQQPIGDNDQTKYNGIDVILVNHISKTLNLMPKYIQSSDVNKRGIIYKNGSATGAFGMVSFLLN